MSDLSESRDRAFMLCRPKHPGLKIGGTRRKGETASPFPLFFFFSVYYLLSSGRPGADWELGLIPQRCTQKRSVSSSLKAREVGRLGEEQSFRKFIPK